LATTIGALSNPFGCITGFILGSLYISDKDKENHEEGKKHVLQYLWFTSIVVTAMCVPAILFLQERPKECPSESAKS
jgi:hypothetical protein